MEKGLFEKVDGKYGSISTFIKALAERNDLDVAGYKAALAKLVKEFDSFGDVYTEFMVGYLDEIKQFEKDREKWNAEKLETDEIIKRLEERLKELEKQVPQADYDYWVIHCEKQYEGYWGLLEEDTKTFLVTARYLYHLVQSHSIDYSIIILELIKSVEKELKEKIYYPFLNSTTRIYDYTEYDRNGRETAFFKYVNVSLDRGKYFIPLGVMFVALGAEYEREDDYYYRLQEFLKKHGWKKSILCSNDFVNDGINYADAYRNQAAHEKNTNKRVLNSCNDETQSLVFQLLKANPKVKS